MQDSHSRYPAKTLSYACKTAMQFRIEGWEDGKEVKQLLVGLDRWRVHSADRIIVEISGGTIILEQKPLELSAKKLGVGACVWDGAFMMAAYLAEQQSSYEGKRCVEVGAGPGLVGLVLAKLGAEVIITDKKVLVPLIEKNIEDNCLSNATARELEWGAPGYMEVVRRLAAPKVDIVIAADCVYPDQDGQTPSVPDFVAACAGLCTSSTKCLVSFETRSSELRQAFLSEASVWFNQVKLIAENFIPALYRVEHLEMYELALLKGRKKRKR